jgi:hypothetical protein
MAALYVRLLSLLCVMLLARAAPALDAAIVTINGVPLGSGTPLELADPQLQLGSSGWDIGVQLTNPGPGAVVFQDVQVGLYAGLLDAATVRATSPGYVHNSQPTSVRAAASHGRQLPPPPPPHRGPPTAARPHSCRRRARCRCRRARASRSAGSSRNPPCRGWRAAARSPRR